MRDICISTETFARIWSLRQEGEETENEILQRLLVEVGEKSPMYSNGAGSEKFGQTAGAAMKSGSVENAISFEVDAHSSWWEVVHFALHRLGGEASLHHIYREVEFVCKNVGKKLPRRLDATVRGTLEDNCAQSHRYKAVRDVFGMPFGKGKGIWNLKRS